MTPDRLVCLRLRLDEIRRRLAESPDDTDLALQATRVDGVIKSHEQVAMVRRAVARWYLHQDAEARRN